MAQVQSRGTVGHTIATDVMADGPRGKKGPGNVQVPKWDEIDEIRVKPGDNGGASVMTRRKPTAKHKEFDPSLEQNHMFRDASEAHGHIGAMMGLRLAEGKVQQ